MQEPAARVFFSALSDALGVTSECASRVRFEGTGNLPSAFAVSDFAAAAIGVAGAATTQWLQARGATPPEVCIDRRLASLWFGFSLKPVGWSLPAPWDALAGIYPATDGWIRLHTNAPHHRRAALEVLGVPGERAAVAEAVRNWHAEALESAIIEKQGCAAALHSAADWATHPQGQSVQREPLVAMRGAPDTGPCGAVPSLERPLAGVRVLDLTRVLAGPVATRHLAGLGAEVLRIDPPDWDEPSVIPDVTLGKRCARLDLHDAVGRRTFLDLLRSADVLVHGYRTDALDRLGLDENVRRAARPGLVDVALNAYGWSGPWRLRRGFDSLVQMSCGIAESGMRDFHSEEPRPLPVQALDHATGYLMAAAVIRGLTERRLRGGGGFEARASLARTAHLLMSGPAGPLTGDIHKAHEEDWAGPLEPTAFGPARRLQSPLRLGGQPLQWDRAASALGSFPPQW